MQKGVSQLCNTKEQSTRIYVATNFFKRIVQEDAV